MSKKNISQEKIIQAFLASAFDKGAGATSLADVSEGLEIKKGDKDELKIAFAIFLTLFY